MASGADPVEPPVPVPNVPGADVGAHGLPDRSELTPQQRFIVDASAIADLGLRTFVASIVGVAMIPPIGATLLRRSATHRERDNLRFYAELAAAKDPAVSFPAPTAQPRIYSRPANPVAEWLANGRVHNIKFNSSFEAINPAMR